MENENNICIDDIMQQIKNEIKEKNLTSDMLSFDDVPYKTAEEMNLTDKNIYIQSCFDRCFEVGFAIG